jgi:hypothetical protein
MSHQKAKGKTKLSSNVNTKFLANYTTFSDDITTSSSHQKAEDTPSSPPTSQPITSLSLSPLASPAQRPAQLPIQ